MRFSTLTMAAGVAATSSDHLKANNLPELSSSNRMGTLMQLKTSQRDESRAAGLFDEGRYQSMSATPCTNGSSGEYKCQNVNLVGSLSHGDMGSTDREGNDIWGWTSADGREFALVGQTDGTAFVEVLEGSLAYLGRLSTQTVSSSWRDLKVIGDYVYIGSEASNHGIQIFDLKKLLNADPSSPTEYSTSDDLAALFDGVGSSHNVVVNEATQTLFVVGAKECEGGLVMVDVSDPSSPKQVGCASEDGYVHDAQCVVYDGIDQAYAGREICFGYNEDTFTIYDVTDKSSPRIVSTTPYDGAAYTHQGWVIDSDYRYVLLDDELDESYGTGGSDGHTLTYIFDITSLESPQWTGTYVAPQISIDHNQYVIDGISYQANYGSGLRILDVSSVLEDPSGEGISEIGHFDCYPDDDADPKPTFVGAWSVYPYFSSGTLIVNCIERGLFAVKYTG